MPPQFMFAERHCVREARRVAKFEERIMRLHVGALLDNRIRTIQEENSYLSV